MIRGLYAAASTMLAAFTRQEQNAANIANINTPGYKREITPVRSGPVVGEVRSFDGLLSVAYPTRPFPLAVGNVGTGVLNDPVTIDFSDGDIRPTGRELDLALVGPGFFELRSATGQTYYARAGQFSRDAGGRIVDSKGGFAIGDDGPITLGTGVVSIGGDGTVHSDGQEVGRLRIWEFPPNTAMRSLGGGSYAPVDPKATRDLVSDGTAIQQGAIEYSNVDPARAMAEMLAATRTYEAAQRIMQMSDAILERSVNDIGRV
ncbi:MAG: flagellar hook-basal body protein [Chloroflexota bacterium]|nr:MAG: flagellar hook-basal body protein [Chloroflexota bacterium]